MSKFIPGLIVALSVSFPVAAISADTSRVEQGFKNHAAMAQLHRWYQFYENSEIPIENQLDILNSDIIVNSTLGTAKGHADYKKRVAQIPASWKNAHFVTGSDMAIGEDGAISLSADIIYANQGMLPEGQTRTAELTYTTKLVSGDGVLPKFTEITITPKKDGTAEEFTSAYGENRLLSLVHYWLALIEDPSRNPQPVEEILADSFSLNFSSGPITDFDGFKAWLAGPASQVSASTHDIKNFAYQDLGDNRYTLSVDFDWEGILPDGTELEAETRHTWNVIDNPIERFARIKSVDMSILKPFQPKK